MSGSLARVVVVGVGNVLRGDDGAGVHVVHALEAQVARGDLDLPAGTRLVDGGTLGVELLAWLAGADAAVIVDAARLGGRPGTVTVVRDAALAVPAGGPDRQGVAELLAVLRLADALPGGISLVGITPATFEGARLDPAVRAHLAEAMQATIDEVRRLAATGGLAAGEPREAGVTA